MSSNIITNHNNNNNNNNNNTDNDNGNDNISSNNNNNSGSSSSSSNTSNKSSSKSIIINPDPSRLVYKYKGYYEAIAEVILEGSRVFVQDMNNRQASYARKKLTKLIGVEIKIVPAIYDGKDGYLIYIP